MNVFEDFSEEIRRRRDRLSDGVLLSCVTADTLVELEDGWKKFYEELNLDSCLERNWRGLAGKLLKPPPTSSTIKTLSKSTSPARELLTTWEAQSHAANKTFDALITTMEECELYSACDEVLEFLETWEKGAPLGLEEPPEESNEVVSYKPIDVKSKIIQGPNVVGCFARVRRQAKKIFKRCRSYLPVIPCQSPTFPPKLPQDEILIVSSSSDHQTEGMKDLMYFVKKLQPVTRGVLTLKTIHDLDHHGQVMTTRLQERVNRAKFVILCFSAIMKQIIDGQSDTPQCEHQTEYIIKYIMHVLVNGILFIGGCQNPKGKFIPVLLPGHDISTLNFPLMCYLHFSWPQEKKRISNYIMDSLNTPYPRKEHLKSWFERHSPGINEPRITTKMSMESIPKCTKLPKVSL